MSVRTLQKTNTNKLSKRNLVGAFIVYLHLNGVGGEGVDLGHQREAAALVRHTGRQGNCQLNNNRTNTNKASTKNLVKGFIDYLHLDGVGGEGVDVEHQHEAAALDRKQTNKQKPTKNNIKSRLTTVKNSVKKVVKLHLAVNRKF